MSVAIAARVYGSELRIALIDYYREHPGTSQKAARTSLDIPQSAVSANLTTLVQAGVLVSEADPTDRRHRVYSLDLQRARELLSALSRHVLGASLPDPNS